LPNNIYRTKEKCRLCVEQCHFGERYTI
jgi:hypothetical protein